VLHSGAFWDLGVAEVSTRAEVRAAWGAMVEGRRTQRYHGWRAR
jgi:TPP-dependent trihydroxycyclohexane-1,2-dione (THcHDO) dehydratase